MNDAHLAAVVETFGHAITSTESTDSVESAARHAVRVRQSLGRADSERRGLTTSEDLAETITTIRHWVARAQASSPLDAEGVLRAADATALGATTGDIRAVVAGVVGDDPIEFLNPDLFEAALVSVAIGVVQQFSIERNEPLVASLRALSPERDEGDQHTDAGPLLR